MRRFKFLKVRSNVDLDIDSVTKACQNMADIKQGALILLTRKNNLDDTAARCILPVTSKTDIPGHYGLRHRAAIGVTEFNDCIALVVSEETGNISMITGGEIRTVKASELKEAIEKEMKN